MSWQTFEVSPDQTHHLAEGAPAYSHRFQAVLKFHTPGLAPVSDHSGSYHIDADGNPAYPQRFIRTFGFYEGKAAVQSTDGWYHILPDGTPLYEGRYAWCGNFQQSRCAVKDLEGLYFHITQAGDRVYTASYSYAGDFRDGYAVVMNQLGLNTHINLYGHLLHGKQFLDLDCFHKGYARAQDEKGWFHINSRGEPLYTARYKNIEPFYNGVTRAEKKDGSLVLLNEQGLEVHHLRLPLNKPFHAVSADLVSYWRFYTLHAACHLKLFDLLPASTADLSEKLSLKITPLYKLLSSLVEMGYLTRDVSQIWHLAEKGSFLTQRHPSSLLAAQKLWSEEHLTAWSYLLDSLRTGKPAFEAVFKSSWFKYIEDKPETKTLYHSVLSTYSKNDYESICSTIDLKKHTSIIDIGGSSGTLLFQILEQNRHLKGYLLDLPEVVSLVKIPLHLEKQVELIKADFFQPWPDLQVDCAILSRVLHDWSDENCLHILHKGAKITSTFYIIENILTPTNGALLDLHMYVMTEGRERTFNEFEKLFKEAGMEITDLSSLNEVSTVLTLRKSSC